MIAFFFVGIARGPRFDLTPEDNKLVMSDVNEKESPQLADRKSALRRQERQKRIKRRLATYATAAVAANVGFSDSVQADVVFNNLNDVMILEEAVGEGVVVGFDLDGNGTVDLNLAHQRASETVGTAVAFIPGDLVDTNAIIATGSGTDAQGVGDPFYVRNLVSSTRINASLTPWATPTYNPMNSRGDLGYLAFGTEPASCPDCEFPSGTSGFIGVQFDADGTTNYGWLRLSVEGSLNKITVHSSAYDNMGMGIHVPEPSGLGLLALGGVGLAAMRRRRTAKEAQ